MNILYALLLKFYQLIISLIITHLILGDNFSSIHDMLEIL